MLTVPTPEAPQATCTPARPAIPPSPLRDRVGHSDHDRFRGYFPVHFIPAYNLPVYASQWPLPDTTQDSVRGCSLGFTAAAIAGDRVQRTLHGATPTERSVRICRTTLFDRWFTALAAICSSFVSMVGWLGFTAAAISGDRLQRAFHGAT